MQSLMQNRTIALVALIATSAPALAQPINASFGTPTFDRWNYPFNATPGVRETASTFNSGDFPGTFDDRDGQFLTSFVTAGQVPPSLPVNQYRVTSAQVTARIDEGDAFAYDPTSDSFASYLPTTDPSYVPDADTGRAVELFGTGFRNGLNAFAYGEDFAFAFADPTLEDVRNAFAQGFDSAGNAVDVSNNVRDRFEAEPWAVGQASVTPGDLVGAGTDFTFDLNTANPAIQQYLRESLHSGILSTTITSLHTAPIGGGAITFPVWQTKESTASGAAPASLTLTVRIVPAPGSISMLALGTLVAVRRRR